MTALFNEVVQLRVQVKQHGQPGNVTLSISTDSDEKDALLAIGFMEQFTKPIYRKAKSRRINKGHRICEIIF